MERWAEIEAELIDRHAGRHNATGLALLDACKMIARLKDHLAEIQVERDAQVEMAEAFKAWLKTELVQRLGREFPPDHGA
jgi:hypothetical protein